MSHRTTVDRSERRMTRRRALQTIGAAGLVVPAAGLTAADGFAAGGSGLNRLLAAFQEAPVQGGSVTVVTEADWVELEPHTNALWSGMQAWEFCYESLTRFDMDGNVAPALAVSWEMPDEQTYIFHLRQGVTWHDGSPFTAADVTYSFERVLDPATAAPHRSNIEAVTSIEALDDFTVRIELERPRLFFLESLANLLGTAIIPNGAAENRNLKAEPVGTGPFKIVEIRTGDYIRYERNPDYWNAPLPYLDEMILKLMVEEDTRVAWLRSGQADYIDLYAEAASRLQGDENVVVLVSPKAYMLRVCYNCQEGPTADNRVRKALDMALDRLDMIEKARFGGATLTGMLPAGLDEWAQPEEALPEWFSNPDPEAARALLDEAGYGDGFSISIKASRPEHVAIALVAQQNWREIGVEAQVEQMEYGTFIQDWGASNFEAMAIGMTYHPDPLNYLWPIFHTDGADNRSRYSNPTVDELLDRAANTTDRDEYREAMHEAERFMWEDGTPQSYVYNALNYEGLRTRIQGYVPQFSSRRTAMNQVWIQE